MEADFLRWLAARTPPDARLPLGLTDDAALVALPAQEPGGARTGAGLVATVDMLTDGVDFRLGEVDPRRSGTESLGGESERLGGDGGSPAGGAGGDCPAASRKRRAGPRALRRTASAGPRVRHAAGRRRHEHLGWPTGRECHAAGPCRFPRAAHARRRSAGRCDRGHRPIRRQLGGASFRFHAAHARGADTWPSTTRSMPGSM